MEHLHPVEAPVGVERQNEPLSPWAYAAVAFTVVAGAARFAMRRPARVAAPLEQQLMEFPVAARAARCPVPVMRAAILEKAAPPGPDPYKMVENDLEYIKRSIKDMLAQRSITASRGDKGGLSGNAVFTMAAREFMGRKGKSFRPMLVLLLGRATAKDYTTDARHLKLAVISEMIHTASLIHVEVLESDTDSDSKLGTKIHQEVDLEVGNKVCVLARAALELSLLEDPKVVEIVAKGLEAICEG